MNKSLKEKSIGLSDEEKIVLYAIEHALAADKVDLSYLGSETDLSLEALREAINGLKRRKLITGNKEYEPYSL